MGRAHGGVTEHGVALQLLDHLLVFLAGLHAVDAEGHDLQTPQIPPLVGQHLVEGIGDLHGVAGQSAVADAHIGNLGKGRLQGGQQLAFQLAVQTGAVIGAAHIAADVGVKQNGVADAVAVLTEAADGNVHI